MLIAVVSVVSLAFELRAPKVGDDAANAEYHTAGSPKVHSTFHKVALVYDVFVSALLAATLLHARRLRKLLAMDLLGG